MSEENLEDLLAQQEREKSESDEEEEEEECQVHRQSFSEHSKSDEEGEERGHDSGSEESTSVAISSVPPTSSQGLTFNSQVLVDVEEYIYFSVKLGIKFQLLNNNIVVGPCYDEIPQHLVALVEAIRANTDQEYIAKARTTLLIAEAVEREEDIASQHALSREDILSVRHHAEADDMYFCKGLLTANCKNTFLTYPPLKPNSKKKRRPSAVNDGLVTKRTRNSTPKLIALIDGSEKKLSGSRDGTITWKTIRTVSFDDQGALQVTISGSRPPIHGVKPSKSSAADSFQINKKRLSGTSNPLDTDVPSSLDSKPTNSFEEEDREIDECSDDNATNELSDDDHDASWADEQSADVMTYYINASTVTPIASTSNSNLPEATATTTNLPNTSPGQIGFDPRSPSLSATTRSPAAYVNAGVTSTTSSTSTPVTIQAVPVNVVVTDNVPFERPPSLSVQQEYQLRNGSIRNAHSSGSLNKASLRTGAEPVIQAIDLSAEMSQIEHSDDEDDDLKIRVSAGEAGKTIPSKIVVKSEKHFGENIKKVWKCDLPVKLSTECIQNMITSSPPQLRNDINETELVIRKICELLQDKFAFPFPYWESTDKLLEDAGCYTKNGSDEPVGEYFIQEKGCSKEHSSSTEITEMKDGESVTVVEEYNVIGEVTAHKMLVHYFDDDVDDYVFLDPDTLEDFSSQTKKALRVDYTSTHVVVVCRTLTTHVRPDHSECVEVDEEIIQTDETKNESCSVGVSVSTCGDEDTTVIPVSTEAVEWSADDKKAELSPYGQWKWLRRCDIRCGESEVTEGSLLDLTMDSWLRRYYVGPQLWSTLVAVNGIRMKDLEKSLIFSMLKQRQRPLVLEFESRHGDESFHKGVKVADEKKKGGSQGKQDGHLPPSTFLAKYSHPMAKSLRKQVEKLLKNFDSYEWVLSSSPGEEGHGSSPQVFVTSLYRSIESELENLGLFDSSTPQGGGVPVMTESHWEDVRMHIETLVFNSIYGHVRKMAPVQDVYELMASPISGAPDQRSMVPLNTKCAFLSFLTLKDMGMDLPEGILSPKHYSLAKYSCPPSDFSQSGSNSLPEEWRIGIKELCRATELRSPLKIMQRLRYAVMLLTHAIEALIGRPLKYTNETAALDAIHEANSIDEKTPVTPLLKSQKNVIHREYIRPAGYYNPVTLGADELMPVLSWAIIQANPPDLDMAVWLCGEFRHPANHMGESAYTLTQVSSALEFVKAATWKDFEVTEPYYRHGLQLYEVTQDLILACKSGKGRGDIEKVRTLLEKGADINGLSVDQSDTPLSAAIKCKHTDLVKYLLSVPNINVNMRISPYFPSQTKIDVSDSKSSDNSSSGGGGGKGVKSSNSAKKDVLQDYTVLMVAAYTGQLTVVALLLDHGADRYLVNEAGDTATSLARSGGHREVMRVLMADHKQYSLIDLVSSEDTFLLRGMLLQQTVDVNEAGLICNFRNDEGDEGNIRNTISIYGTPIHAAVYFRDINVTNVLLNCHRIDVNKSNDLGETALMWCGASNTVNDSQYTVDIMGNIVLSNAPHDNSLRESMTEDELEHDEVNKGDISRVQIACMLLQHQADRYLVDSYGRTALHWAMHGKKIASCPLEEQQQHLDLGDIHLDELPFIPTKCRYPRLAAVLYYDPAKYKIYHLARDGCIAGVRALLDQGVSINESCPEGWYTPLIASVYNKDVTMARFLLQFSSIEVNFKGKHQTTALHYAAQEGCLAICGLLLFHKADRNALTTSGLLPIDFALSKGHKEIAACLRFDPQKVSICLAAKHGDTNVFSALINQGISVNTRLRHVSEKGTHHELTTPLISAVAFGQLEFLRHLMSNKEAILENAFYFTHLLKSSKQSGEDIDVDGTNFVGQTALMYAAANGDEDMTLFLLKLGANRHKSDNEGRTAAKWAKQSNHSSIYMILLCDPAISSVHEAIREGNKDATIAFFKQEPNPNIRYFSSIDNNSVSTSKSREGILDGECPIIVAAKFGRLEIIRLLFRAPEIEIDNVDTFGKTALMHAAERGHESVLLLLLKHRANRAAMCYSQKRAIDYAAAANHSDIVDILDADPYRIHIQDAAERGNARHVNALLKQGCPPNYRDERTGKRNRTALMCAASKGRLNVVKLLLSLSTANSIDVDLQDADGMTALMHAAKIGNLEVTGALLAAGCKRDIVDAKGRTAQSHASSHGFITGTQFKAQLMWR